MSSLRSLSLSDTQISGIIPSQIFNLLDLEKLYLSQNPHLIVTIPTEIGNLLSLSYLAFSSSQLNGTIPTEIGKCYLLLLFF
jgi:LRR receptor-like serine/threonine-protein kinase FLS2